jgi:transcriptional regulator with XRE-family HTH domain
MRVMKPHFVRAWRRCRGLTQAQLAERIGIDRSYLSNIETGQRRYDQPFLEAAAEALRCSPADLISRDPTTNKDIADLWSALTPEQRQQAIAVLKAMFATAD